MPDRRRHSEVPVESIPQIELTDMHKTGILICMRTTLNIDDELLVRAAELTGITEKTSLVRRGLQALIEMEAARRLAKLGGTEPDVKAIPRRRPGPR